MEGTFSLLAFLNVAALTLAAILIVTMAMQYRRLLRERNDAQKLALHKSTKRHDTSAPANNLSFEPELLELLKWTARHDRSEQHRTELRAVVDSLATWMTEARRPRLMGSADLSKLLQHRIHLVRTTHTTGLQVIAMVPHRLPITQSIPHLELLTHLLLDLAATQSQGIITFQARVSERGMITIQAEYGRSLVSVSKHDDHFAFGSHEVSLAFAERYNRALLAMLRSTVEQMGGTAHVHTNRTEGTMVHITLPDLSLRRSAAE
jgi:hypothetical protein